MVAARRRRRSRAEQPGATARARRHLADRSRLPAAHERARRARRRWTSSRCTAFRSTGTTGRSTSGRDKLDEIRAVTDARLGVRGRRLDVRRRGGAGVRAAAHRGAARRPRATASTGTACYDLPQGVAGDDAASRGGGLVLLPPLLHGPAARGRHAQARARRSSRRYAPALGICQWFHFEDPRLDEAVRWLKRLGVRHLRTGLSWADSLRPERGCLVRPPDARARAVRRDAHVLLHARVASRHRAAPHEPAARPARVR